MVFEWTITLLANSKVAERNAVIVMMFRIRVPRSNRPDESNTTTGKAHDQFLSHARNHRPKAKTVKNNCF
jgi:hypothetical protein